MNGEAKSSPPRVASREFSLAGWRVVLSDLGLSHRNILRRAGLPEDLFARDNPRVGVEEYYALWHAVSDEADNPRFPLAVGQALSVEAFDPVIFAATCSPDYNTAARRIDQYKRLIGPLRCRPEIGPTATRIEIEFPAAGGPPPLAFAMVELIFPVALARLCTRAHIKPLSVTSATELPKPASAYLEYFGVPVERGDRHSVAFSAGDAARPFLTSNETMWGFFEKELRHRLDQLTADASTAERTRAALLELLPAGLASTDEVASRLGISKRTLQRRLSAEGVGFQTLLDQTRERLARHYLRHSAMTGAEISFLLGYEDPNSFFRAFHAWTGQTPETVRAQTH